MLLTRFSVRLRGSAAHTGLKTMRRRHSRPHSAAKCARGLRSPHTEIPSPCGAGKYQTSWASALPAESLAATWSISPPGKRLIAGRHLGKDDFDQGVQRQHHAAGADEHAVTAHVDRLRL